MMCICHDFRDGVFFHNDGRITVVSKDGAEMEFKSLEEYIEFRQMVIEIAPKITKVCKEIASKLKEKKKISYKEYYMSEKESE